MSWLSHRERGKAKLIESKIPHLVKLDYSCPMCGAMYEDNDSLGRHASREHPIARWRKIPYSIDEQP